MFARPLRWVLLVAGLLAGCAPSRDQIALDALNAQLAKQYHECVPLGWSPVTVAGTYYPGVSVILDVEGWLPARWIGLVRKRNLGRADVRTISAVLDDLVRVGLLERDAFRGGGGVRYNLSTAALPFYYDENQHGNNPAHIPYLCYSTIVPTRVEWSSLVYRERARDGSHDVDAFDAVFEWKPGPVAAWANDPFLRSHSVKLGPTESPVTATFVNSDGDWTVAKLSTSFPAGRVVDASVWPHPRL